MCYNVTMKKLLTLFILVLFICTSFISAMDITFFYSDDCSHCSKIKPLMFNLAQQSYRGHWNLYETSDVDNQKAFLDYGFSGVPAFVINTNDNRIIKFTGTNLLKLNCELNEMTTKDCPTYSADTCIGGSWFKI